MIDILDGVRVNGRLVRAVTTTVNMDASYLTHIFASDFVTLKFNNDANDFRIFATKGEYLDYLIGMYEEGAIFGDKPLEYRSMCQAVLEACRHDSYLRGKLEFTFDEMKAITEHYNTGWFSRDNMERLGTVLIKTLPYRMFVTTDKGYRGLIIANLRMMTKDGYIVTLVNNIPDVDKALEIAKAIESLMMGIGSKQRAIMANLRMVWDTSNERHDDREYVCALTFEDFNGNLFTIASNTLNYFMELN